MVDCRPYYRLFFQGPGLEAFLVAGLDGHLATDRRHRVHGQVVVLGLEHREAGSFAVGSPDHCIAQHMDLGILHRTRHDHNHHRIRHTAAAEEGVVGVEVRPRSPRAEGRVFVLLALRTASGGHRRSLGRRPCCDDPRCREEED